MGAGGRKVVAVGMWVLGLSLMHLGEGALDLSVATQATAAPFSTQNSPDPVTLQQILHTYRTGHAQDAINQLAKWSVDRLAAAAAASTPTLSSSDRMAAAILEAEVASTLLATGRPKDALAVIEGALALLHDAGRAPFGEKLGEEPRRSWYYAVTSALVGDYRTREALLVVEIGLKEYPDDALLLTARGTISGRRWDVINLGNGHSRARTKSLKTFQAKAEGDYKQALQLRPDLAVAKLRLGQLYVEAGHEREATPWLQLVAMGAATDHEQYFAHLLLGRIAVKEHRLEAADAEYHKAYAIGRYQAACIAMSQLEAGLDHREQPGQMAEDCLRELEGDDPWLYWRTKDDPDALPHLRAEARGE